MGCDVTLVRLRLPHVDGRADTGGVAPTANASASDDWSTFAATVVRLWGENPCLHDLLMSAPVALRESVVCTGRVSITLQRLLAKDLEVVVRGHIARLADEPELLDALADDPSVEVQAEVANNFYTAQSTRRRMLNEGSDSIKVRAITSTATDMSVIEDFLESADADASDSLPWAVRVARFCPNLAGGLLQRLLNHPDELVRQGLADNEFDYPGKAEAVERLSRDPSPSVRTELVMTYDTPSETVNRMCDEEGDPSLRLWFVSNAYGVWEGTVDKMLTDPSMQDALSDLEQRRGSLPERLAARRSVVGIDG